ncbi:hypothetical protein SAMN05920897_11947 [Alkalispirochaeta americana]|uniref:Phosphoesterase n=1 Tax=Alkalispirochaeta americana TaxID=159291 RepID=A0A1N6WZ51_9SPIO|nr:YfcE family phosphodiesterase [Alkalispirochaeta americana]SIQ95394.1 hypothetical protein SAMN05920897_11947 [Alkalispirochaeta americana]
MKIAIMSDIHDNIWNLERALQQVQDQEARTLLFLGDFCAPFTLDQLARGFSGPIHAILGNNDGDPLLLSRIAGEHPHVTLHGHVAELTFEGVKIAMNHYPEIARGLAHSRLYDAVFSGHDHQRYHQKVENTLWANPGEVMGRFGKPSFGIFLTGDLSFVHVDIDLSRRVAGHSQ